MTNNEKDTLSDINKKLLGFNSVIVNSVVIPTAWYYIRESRKICDKELENLQEMKKILNME